MTSPITIPHDRLDADTLRRLVSEFVSRDGTDYGRIETPMSQKVERAIHAIHAGEVLIAFDPISQTTTLISKDDYRTHLK